MIRRLAAATLVLAAASLLGGCVVIQSTTWEQQDVVGDVRVTVTVCASGNTNAGDGDTHPGCPYTGNSGDLADDDADSQLLFGLRLADGVAAPETISGTPTPAPPAAGPVVLRRSAEYEVALTAGAPPSAGTRWVGYISDPYAYSPGAGGTPAQSVALTFDLPLPPTADGAPHFGPLAIQPVVGARQVTAELPASRPLVCGPDVYERAVETQAVAPNFIPTICIDSPAQIVIDNPIQIPTRDFGIVAGAATASPGQTVQIPFGVRGAGNLPGGLAASLTAATTLAGASAAPSRTSAPLANGSDTRVTVAVAIPRDAGPGTHDVTLTGRLDNGQARVGTARLTVRDRHAPRLTGVRVKPRKVRPATRRKPRRRATVAYRLSEPAKVVGTVQRCTRQARAKRGGKRRTARRCVRYRALRGRLRADGAAGANRIRFNGRLRRRPLRPGRYRLTLVATDAAGNRSRPARAAFLVPRRSDVSRPIARRSDVSRA